MFMEKYGLFVLMIVTLKIIIVYNFTISDIYILVTLFGI